MRRRWTRGAAKWALAAVTAVTVVAWPLSRWWMLIGAFPGEFFISVHSGCLWFGKSTPPPAAEPALPVGIFFLENGMGRELGLTWRFVHLKHKLGESVMVPLWSIVPVLGLGTGLLWRAEVRRLVRRRRGLCLACGYDRRGLAVGVRCPECGTVPKAG